ncbi:alpha/beta fold hydrolase [Pseudalkalibacillus caeni]|uniref:Alpha/beta hydrolase n=1 Tax=Exobacillus caeni TaxID=2574798 RepID=A0A5R9F845_9BACL|nr:alpha/beta hydrolase [Pseudalkalibacillus caeni]TLS36684.1 alpha/beta hydrolase [Pseudalkalibacillus caeni]
MPTVHLENELEVYYEEAGRGMPILFLHPPGMGLVTFYYQQALADQFRVIAYDIRGHGYSGLTEEPLSIGLLAEDLLFFMNALNIEKAVVCGYSAGGSIALDFALKHPERMEALILSGGFSEVNDFWLRNEFKAGIALSNEKRLPFLAKAVSLGNRSTKADTKMLYDYFMKSDPLTLRKLYKEGLDYNCTKHLPNIKCPLMVVEGQFAFYFHHYQMIFQSLVPNVETARVSKGFHELPMKFHDPFNHVVRTFLNKVLYSERSTADSFKPAYS